MAEELSNIIAEFNAFIPQIDESENVIRLRALADRWIQQPSDKRAESVAAILGIFERNPGSDALGSPGPLVHAIEKHTIEGGMGRLIMDLADSVTRTPSYYTVWMVNRLLNAETKPDKRVELVAILRAASQNPTARKSVGLRASRFLKRQQQT